MLHSSVVLALKGVTLTITETLPQAKEYQPIVKYLVGFNTKKTAYNSKNWKDFSLYVLTHLTTLTSLSFDTVGV